MPMDGKETTLDVRARRRPRRSRVRLAMPVIGMEAEFNVLLDGAEIDPRAYWGHPLAFIQGSLLPREKSSFQLPTGGAVYFDRGVIEVVTPVIELAPGATARVVRNLWEGIAFVRAELTKWEGRTGHAIRLKAYSAHYNVSFEVPAALQSKDRNARSLARLLADILPLPVALLGTNRRSTGVGVRPRGDRIEVTVDFTPDPGLMIATATLIVGIVREVLSWPSYSLDLLDRLPIPTVDGLVPGKHTTRKGWLTKDFQYPQSPYTSDVDDPLFPVRDGRKLSVRQIAREVAWYFRHSIRRHSDPFSFRLVFAVLEGRLRSMLELPDRPAAYEDVGELCRWGMVLPDLARPRATAAATGAARAAATVVDMQLHIEQRRKERESFMTSLRAPTARRASARKPAKAAVMDPTLTPPAGDVPEVAGGRAPVKPNGRMRGANPGTPLAQRTTPRTDERSDAAVALTWTPAEPAPYLDRRTKPKRVPERRQNQRRRGASSQPERRRTQRRTRLDPTPFPDRRLTRSAYEKVFLKLVSGGRLRIGRQTWTPVGMKGWYHAIFRNDASGRERLITIDQLLKKMDDWEL
jgi:hypothetical protein